MNLPCPAPQDFSDLSFTQSKTGHVHSPWFSYDYADDLRAGKLVYGFGYGKLSWIMDAAKLAFAEALGVEQNRVAVTELPSQGGSETLWRVSTMDPVELPEKKKKPAQDALDI